MTDKHQAKLAYLTKARSALVKLRSDTEKDLRKLPELSEAEVGKLITAVEKRHAKMLRKIDGQIALEKRKAA